MYGEYEQTKIDFKDMTDDHTHVLYLFNKQTNTENTASNYKFIHC